MVKIIFYELWYLICDDDEEELYWIVSPIIWVKVIFDNWTFFKILIDYFGHFLISRRWCCWWWRQLQCFVWHQNWAQNRSCQHFAFLKAFPAFIFLNVIFILVVIVMKIIISRLRMFCYQEMFCQKKRWWCWSTLQIRWSMITDHKVFIKSLSLWSNYLERWVSNWKSG